MTTLLILTTGQSDVQVVDDGARHELDGKTCGELHDGIAKRAWSVVESPLQKGKRISTLPADDLVLCTPKLDAMLDFFGGVMPTSVLVFETRRTLGSDPRSAGTVLERRLRERGISRIQRIAFLEGNERLEDRANDMDSIVRQTIVERLSRAIADALEVEKPKCITVATTGGLAAANAVIEELVRLHAVGGPTVTSFEVSDGGLENRKDRAVPERLHPAAGYRARWHALSLIEKGNLLGAWGAVSHLTDEPGQEWTRVIRWLACFSSSLPMPEGCDIAVLTHPRMAVRAALRVELALRADDIPRAVHGTVAFFEAAFWDWVKEYDFGAEGITRINEMEYHLPSQPSKDQKERFKRTSGFWRVNDFDPGVKAWLPVLGKPKLSAFRQALGDDIRDLRNDAAHNEPTPQRMNDARRMMADARLWSEDGKLFLTQALVRDVLLELGEENPEHLCTDLVSVIRTRLINS